MVKETPVFLFAEGDATPTRPLRAELRRRGARVLRAGSLDEAIREADRCPPDLFVLDDHLDGSRVPDVAAFFRASHPRAEIILLIREPAELPRGLGLGLLYSGGRDVGNESLLEVILSAFPGRLTASGSKENLLGRILCVDDDAAFLRSLRRLLRRHGYQVSAYEDAGAALAAIPSDAPDLALLDVAMPGMDGLGLAREIRHGYGRLIPIVFLSGRTSSAVRAAGYLHGASYFVAKGSDPSALLDVVDYYAADLDTKERELLEARM